MSTKTCSKCGAEKALSEFYFRKDSNRYNGTCKSCCLQRYHDNREHNIERNRNWKNNNKTQQLEYKTKYRTDNKQTISEYNKLYREENKESLKIANKLYKEENKTKISIQHKAYIKAHKEEIRIQSNIYARKKYKDDVNYRLSVTLRNGMNKVITIQNGKRNISSIDLLGCTLEECRNHIEAQFKEGMTWENHGLMGWHIDHIRPCASFDLTDPEQQKQCFHYTNLQPLWAEDNLKKGARWEKK